MLNSNFIASSDTLAGSPKLEDVVRWIKACSSGVNCLSSFSFIILLTTWQPSLSPKIFLYFCNVNNFSLSFPTFIFSAFPVINVSGTYIPILSSSRKPLKIKSLDCFFVRIKSFNIPVIVSFLLIKSWPYLVAAIVAYSSFGFSK